MHTERIRRFPWARLGDVDLCRRLTLDGWQHLVEAEVPGRGVVLEAVAEGPWPFALAAVGLYRGQVDVLVAERSLARQVPRPWLRRFAAATLTPEAALGPAVEALENRGRVLVVVSAAGIAPDLTAGLARRAGAPHLRISAGARRRGRYRVAVDVEPLTST